jgi:isoleucyl-tRNA synthetase
MARAIKDIFCRYKTLKGYLVERKGGWDTHGLPVEIAVEKNLNITKDDIGKTISIEDYNKECRKDVMKYKDLWDDITRKMGYWLDLENPYITFENKIDNYNEINIDQIINEQIRLTYDRDKKMFSNNTEDERTLTSRIYELVRYFKLKNKRIIFKNTI